MKKTLVLIGLVLLFFSTLGFAATIDWSKVDCTMIKYQGKPLSDLSYPIPAQLSPFLNNETLSVHLALKNGQTKVASATIQNNVLSNVACKARKDATVDVYLSEEVMNELSQSKNPVADFKKAKRSDRIRFESHTITTGFKLWVADVFLMFQK